MKIIPCPFCGDEMKTDILKKIAHKNNSDCILFNFKFSVDKWNIRIEENENAVFYRPILKDNRLKHTFTSDYVYLEKVLKDHKYYDYDLIGWEKIEVIANDN